MYVFEVHQKIEAKSGEGNSDIQYLKPKHVWLFRIEGLFFAHWIFDMVATDCMKSFEANSKVEAKN